MKASELIEQLQKNIVAHGDRTVRLWAWDTGILDIDRLTTWHEGEDREFHIEAG